MFALFHTITHQIFTNLHHYMCVFISVSEVS